MIRIPYEQFEKEANGIARIFVDIKTCHKCGHPVASGYQCTFCGDPDPSNKAEGVK